MLQHEQWEWHDTRPAWWLLYGIAVLLVALVGLIERFVDGGGLRQVLEAITVVTGFGLLRLWLRRNRIALELEQGRRRT
jgi:hydrogenase/urease accessory protein HupE